MWRRRSSSATAGAFVRRLSASSEQHSSSIISATLTLAPLTSLAFAVLHDPQKQSKGLSALAGK